MDNNEIINKILSMLAIPGGKAATLSVLEKLDAMPFVSDIFNSDYNTAQNRAEDLCSGLNDWIEQTNPSIEETLKKIDTEVKTPTKENFSFLLGESLGLKTPYLVASGMFPYLVAMLNPLTLQEFSKFENLGLIDIITDKNDTRLNSRSPNEKIFDDIKRPSAMNIKCVIQLNEVLYK